MRVLLVQPPIRDFYFTRGRMEPLGLEYLVASLTAEGHCAQILDAIDLRQSAKIPIPREMAYMGKHYPLNDLSPFRLFSHFQHLGLTFREIALRTAEWQPDLVGIPCNFTPYEGESLECARQIKAKCPQIPIVLGGHHATVEYASLLQNPFVDFIIRGEAERSICLLANALPQGSFAGVPGLAYRLPDGNIHDNPLSPPILPLESLPRPLRAHGSEQMVITSRGCPRRCGFCSISHVMGHQWRQRSVSDVLSEVDEAIRSGAKEIDFEDDSLNWDKVRMLEMMNGLAARYGIAASNRASKRKILFSARNGLIAERLDLPILESMAEAGFERVNLAVVSANPARQHEIERNQPVQRFEEVVVLAQKAGLKVTAYIILGLPTDTLDEMIRTILWVAHLPVEIGPSIFYPVPGTPLFDLCVQRNYINPNNKITFRSSAYPVETEDFSRTDLVTLMRVCRLLNYLKNNESLSKASIQHCNEAALDTTGMRLVKTIDAARQITTNQRLSRNAIGAYLVSRFLENGRLCGLRCLKRRRAPFVYEEIDYAYSEKAAEPILAHLCQLWETHL